MKRFLPIAPATAGRVDAYPELETFATGNRRGRNRVPHVQRHKRGPARMILVWVRHSGGRHVAVADGLDLLESVPLDERVEVKRKPIEDVDHLGRG